MNSIFKVEFKKFIKSKTFIWIVVITVLMPIFMGFMYKILEFMPMYEEIPIYGNLITPFGAYITAFNPVDNFGLIFLILLLVFIVSDFTLGTINNKIVGGYNRKDIYLATSLLVIVIVGVVITIYTLLVYLFAGLFTSFDNIKFMDMFLYWLTALSANFVIYAFIQLIIYKVKTLGGSLGISLGVLFIMMLGFVIISMGIDAKTIEVIYLIVPFLQLFNPTTVPALNSLIMFIVNLAYFSLITYIGVKMNNKEDYK